MRKNLFIIITILSMTIILSTCSTQKNNISTVADTAELTKDQWIEDIDYLEKNLSEKHVNAYHTLTKEEYVEKFDDLKREVPQLKDYEIKLRLAQIVASVGDAHTSVLFNPQEYGNMYYPLAVYWFGSELKVFAISKDYREAIGSNLVAINNIPIEEAINRINTLIAHENEQWLKVKNIMYIQIPEVLEFLNITKEDKAEFAFCDDEGKITKLNLKPIIITNEDIVNVKDSMLGKPVSKQHDANNYYDSLYWYKYIPEDRIMYFQYNICIDRNTARFSGQKDYEKYPDFNKFGDELINELNEKEVDKFIIDLRNNTGGDSSLMTDFVSKLPSIKKLNGNGKIFVLIGRETFSSGVMACTSLKGSTKAIFIGEPTGGNVNGYGDILEIKLPSSKTQVSYSTKYFKLAPEYKEGFTPDVQIEQSFGDYANGIDDVYEAAKSYKINES